MKECTFMEIESVDIVNAVNNDSNDDDKLIMNNINFVSRSPNRHKKSRKPWLREFFLSSLWDFDRPETRCLRQWASYAIFLGLLFAETAKGSSRDMAKYGKAPDVCEWLIIFYLIGSSLQLFCQIRLQVWLLIRG